MGKWELLVGLAVLACLVLTRFEPHLLQRWSQASAHGQPGFALWLAQGFGLGLIPVAPGTFGSLLGLGWFALLLATREVWVLSVGSALGVALSVWCCGMAEKVLGQKDPGSVVLDEVVAIPLCFFAWIGIVIWHTGGVPPLDRFFLRGNWALALGVFAAFRFFDVVKPWPVRQSQALPGGWGVTIDDLLAAGYVNILVLIVYAVRIALTQ